MVIFLMLLAMSCCLPSSKLAQRAASRQFLQVLRGKRWCCACVQGLCAPRCGKIAQDKQDDARCAKKLTMERRGCLLVQTQQTKPLGVGICGRSCISTLFMLQMGSLRQWRPGLDNPHSHTNRLKS